jgi:hypothetical protein
MITVWYCPEENVIYEQYDSDPLFLHSYARPSSNDMAFSCPYRISLSDFKHSLVVLDSWGDTDGHYDYFGFPKRPIPFGKFKGRSVSDVPDSYLTWLRSIAYGALKFWVEDEMMARWGNLRDLRSNGSIFREREFPPGSSGFDGEEYEFDGWGMDPMWDFGDRE